MSTDIFQIPQVEANEDFSARSLMVHDLNADSSVSTKMLEIGRLLAFLQGSEGRITLELIDNGTNELPDLKDGTFTVKENEIVFFKVSLIKNDLDEIDGFDIYVFKKGKGIYHSPSYGSPTEGSVVISEDDFFLIQQGSYSSNTFLGESLEKPKGMLSYKDQTFDTERLNTMEALKRVLSNAQSQLNAPLIDFYWGKEGEYLYNRSINYVDKSGTPRTRTFGNDPDNWPNDYPGDEDWDNDVIPYNLFFPKLGIYIGLWQSFQAFIDSGGRIELMIYRQRKGGKKRVRESESDPWTRYRRPARWSFNKDAEFEGGISVLDVTTNQGYYDIRPEFLLQRRGLGVNSSLPTIHRAMQKQLLGFGLRFRDNEDAILFQTPIVAKLLLNERFDEKFTHPVVGSEIKVRKMGYKKI